MRPEPRNAADSRSNRSVWKVQGREPLIAIVRQQEAQSQSQEAPSLAPRYRSCITQLGNSDVLD
jgi:hypothetical protein